MSRVRAISWGLVVVALVAGTLSDVAPARETRTIGGFRVLEADFHVHSAPVNDGALAPWDLVLEARRRGLDAFAITNHNRTFSAKCGRWFTKLIDGPTVLVGEEVTNPNFHIIAVGIEETVSARGSAAAAIAEIHRQGGVAIAAHPTRAFWPGYDDAAMAALDGSEVAHPAVYVEPEMQGDLLAFRARKPSMAAIGSTDYHAGNSLGFCRTFVFAADASEGAIVDAIRRGRTITLDRDGVPRGDAALIELAEKNGGLPRVGNPGVDHEWLTVVSRVCAILGLLGLTSRPSSRPRTRP